METANLKRYGRLKQTFDTPNGHSGCSLIVSSRGAMCAGKNPVQRSLVLPGVNCWSWGRCADWRRSCRLVPVVNEATPFRPWAGLLPLPKLPGTPASASAAANLSALPTILQQEHHGMRNCYRATSPKLLQKATPPDEDPPSKYWQHACKCTAQCYGEGHQSASLLAFQKELCAFSQSAGHRGHALSGGQEWPCVHCPMPYLHTPSCSRLSILGVYAQHDFAELLRPATRSQLWNKVLAKYWWQLAEQGLSQLGNEGSAFGHAEFGLPSGYDSLEETRRVL